MQAIKTERKMSTSGNAYFTASAAAGRCRIARDYELTDDENHRLAATALCRKFGWCGELVSGTNRDGSQSHVFLRTMPGGKYRQWWNGLNLNSEGELMKYDSESRDMKPVV